MIGQCPGGLDDTDDSIQLMDGTRTVDSVAYTITAPWPAAAAGTGPSMELNDPALDNDVGSSWHASSDSGTPGGSELRRRIGRRRHVDGAQLRGHMEVPGDRAGPRSRRGGHQRSTRRGAGKTAANEKSRETSTRSDESSDRCDHGAGQPPPVGRALAHPRRRRGGLRQRCGGGALEHADRHHLIHHQGCQRSRRPPAVDATAVAMAPPKSLLEGSACIPPKNVNCCLAPLRQKVGRRSHPVDGTPQVPFGRFGRNDHISAVAAPRPLPSLPHEKPYPRAIVDPAGGLDRPHHAVTGKALGQACHHRTSHSSGRHEGRRSQEGVVTRSRAVLGTRR